MNLVVCHTKEDVEKARKEYFKNKRLKLSLIHCVFQKRHHQNKEYHVPSKR